MVDVLVEGSEGLDEEIGFSLSEDMVLLTFPFSAVVPAALEARNKLLLGTENEAGIVYSQDTPAAVGQLGQWGLGDGTLNGSGHCLKTLQSDGYLTMELTVQGQILRLLREWLLEGGV
jgi:hypothetical protein